MHVLCTAQVAAWGERGYTPTCLLHTYTSPVPIRILGMWQVFNLRKRAGTHSTDLAPLLCQTPKSLMSSNLDPGIQSCQVTYLYQPHLYHARSCTRWLLWDSSTQQEMVFLSGILGTVWNYFGLSRWGWRCTRVVWVEPRDAAHYPSVHRTVPHHTRWYGFKCQ